MKKKLLLVVMLSLVMTIALTSTGYALFGPSPAVIEIKEKLFIAQTNDVFANPDEYMGKTIRWEGMYTLLEYPGTGYASQHMVYRNGPGCCGNDGMAGFEIIWDGKYPNENDWVQAEGEIEFYTDAGAEWMRIRVSSLKVLEKRGAETVQQ